MPRFFRQRTRPSTAKLADMASSDEEMGNTEDSDWRERAARARREQRAAEAKRRRGSGERVVWGGDMTNPTPRKANENPRKPSKP